MNSFNGNFDGTKLDINNFKTFGKDARYIVSFIGDIYNTNEIKTKIRDRGIKLTTESYEEIIYNCFINFDFNFPKIFNGSYVFAVADLKENRVLIARDQFGKYPLYYSIQKENLYFSTEINFLTSLNKISRELNSEALNFYLALRYIPKELSIFKNIKKLPSGCTLIYDANKKNNEINQYWKPPKSDPDYGDENELAEKLEELFLNSIEKRISNNKTGAFLSGGIDSCLNVALMSKFSPKKIKTFTIGFKEKKYNESNLSKLIADHFNTEHHELQLTPDFTEHFEKIGEILDEPLADPSIIPTYYACKIASEHCDEMFCGEGADGLFLGLKTHGYAAKYQKTYQYTKYLNPILKNIEVFIPEGLNWKIFLKGLAPDQFFLQRNINYNNQLRRELFSNKILDELNSNFNSPEIYNTEIFSSYNGSYKGKMGNYNSTCFTDNALAMRVRMTKAFSLKYVTPFLDKEFAEFCLTEINPELKLRNGTKKYLLKKVAKKYLPLELPLERKRGFNAPIGKWFRNEWWNYIREKILDINDDIINRKAAETILNRHKNKAFDESRKIFCLLMFKLWEEKHLI